MLSEQNGSWEKGMMDERFGRGINFQIMVAQIEPILKSLEAESYPLMKDAWESWYRKDHDKNWAARISRPESRRLPSKICGEDYESRLADEDFMTTHHNRLTARRHVSTFSMSE